MTNKELLDIYSEYLISSFGQTTGTGLAGLLEGSVSHDQIQRLLGKASFRSANLREIVKPYIREVQQALTEHEIGVCGHSGGHTTLWSCVADLTDRRIAYTNDAPCRAKYVNVEWPM